jgi:hypothetical protein
MPADVAEVFTAYPVAIRVKLKAVRQLIYDVAKTIEGVAPLQETLKWASRLICRQLRRSAARSD